MFNNNYKKGFIFSPYEAPNLEPFDRLFEIFKELITHTSGDMDEALDWLGEIGYDPQFGARPLKRALQKEVINELAKYVLSGMYVKGDTILIDANPTGLTFGRKMVVDGKEVITPQLKLD